MVSRDAQMLAFSVFVRGFFLRFQKKWKQKSPWFSKCFLANNFCWLFCWPILADFFFGPTLARPSAPEKVVTETPQAINALLRSPECAAFLTMADESIQQAGEQEHTFIQKIIEAVSPIIPITLRNRSLDGGYLRTALTLLGASDTVYTVWRWYPP